MLPVWGATVNDGRLVNRVGLSRKHIFDAVQNSMNRLGTYIDVFQIHRMDPDVPHEETMRALNDVVDKGWVRYIGACSMPAWEFQIMQNVADKHGWHKFISMQNYYNPIYREEERGMVPFCKATGVGIIPWSPIARGVLARPHTSYSEPSIRSGSDPTLTRLIKQDDTATKAIIDAVEAIARDRGVSMAQVAIAWSLNKGANPICGLNSRRRIDEAVAGAKLQLTIDEIEKLDSLYISKAVTGY